MSTLPYLECLYNVEKRSVNAQKFHLKTLLRLTKLNHFNEQKYKHLILLCRETLYILLRVFHDKCNTDGLYVKKFKVSRDKKKRLTADIAAFFLLFYHNIGSLYPIFFSCDSRLQP